MTASSVLSIAIGTYSGIVGTDQRFLKLLSILGAGIGLWGAGFYNAVRHLKAPAGRLALITKKYDWNAELRAINGVAKTRSRPREPEQNA
jgi:hypothetical protein